MENKKTPDYGIKASKKYIKNNIVKVTLNININTDSDIYEFMQAINNKNSYLKNLIRNDLKIKKDTKVAKKVTKVLTNLKNGAKIELLEERQGR